MKRMILPFVAVLMLACGNNENADVKVNTDEQSSVVETTNPKVETNNNETGSKEDVLNSGEITSIKFYDLKHDFGNVFYPSENKFTFKFKNTGNAPLIIKDATASCGCTVPNKPEEPIMPGQDGELDVIFRPKEGQAGTLVTKDITVTANTSPEITMLSIQANVLKSM